MPFECPLDVCLVHLFHMYVTCIDVTEDWPAVNFSLNKGIYAMKGILS